ncbi:hypothetical protein J7287_002226 [Vibrio parahaemolyticus]|uniref:hypothetical protein n=1 Tax=Vibrio parahaemolyticus TaxID=670 RepID=UPI00084A9DAF|nr:hypothetical protein [Vibrio parahaemolyticus]EGQ7916016.1 hypothetical protein [Vibrio parahaemolyticus]EGQ9940385.1 hypothetical protein [Vibrio parahaemolyticus]EHH3645901.1 hypothetical protein [Vibrio parahaemolyticus]EHH3735063.1 hypothetical protein [Vibrio parahaemolyticus]EHR1107027.1 hypothetical protein [Vibrio parahaemolyticus]
MLSFEERFAILEQAILASTPDELYNELKSYEAKGPLAINYLEEKVTYKTKVYRKIELSQQGTVERKHIHYIPSKLEPRASVCANDENYSLAA